MSINPCPSRSVSAGEVEEGGWQQVKEVLLEPELLLAEIRRQRESKVEASQLQEEMELNEKRIDTLDMAETRALRLHLYSGMSENKLMKELQRINRERQRIGDENARLKKRLEEARQTELDEAAIVRFCELARRNIESFSFEEKRQTLDTLDINVIVKPDSIAIECHSVLLFRLDLLLRQGVGDFLSWGKPG